MINDKDAGEKYGINGIRVSLPDFYSVENTNKKAMNQNLQSICNITNNKFLPIMAKNRKLLMYELTTASLKEFPLNEIIHIPSANQMCIDSGNKNVCWLSGGHMYKTNASDKLIELQFKASKHTFHKSMTTARWMHRMVQFKNYLYVVGGVGSKMETPLKSCERFNLTTREWEPMADMINARHSMGICAHEYDQKHNASPKLFVFGGVGEKKTMLTEVEEYDMDTDTWRVVYLKNYGQAPKSAGVFAVSVNAQQIAVFGGFRHISYEKGTGKNTEVLYDYPYNNTRIWLYNVEEETVKLMENMTLGYGLFSEGNQTICDGKAVYAVGRFNEKVSHIPSPEIKYRDDEGNKMAAIRIDSNDVAFNDFILLA